MLGASSALISYLAPFPLPWRESQVWEDEMGDLGSDAGLPVLLKPQCTRAGMAGTIHMLQTRWKGLGSLEDPNVHSAEWFLSCPPSWRWCLWPFEFLPTILFILQPCWGSHHFQTHLIWYCCVWAHTIPFSQNFPLLRLQTSYSSFQTHLFCGASSAPSSKIRHLHPCPPKAHSITALRPNIVLPPQTVSVSITRVTSMFYSIYHFACLAYS